MSAIEILLGLNLLLFAMLSALIYRLAQRLRGSEERTQQQVERLSQAVEEQLGPDIARLQSAIDKLAVTPVRSAKPLDFSNLPTTDLLDQLREAKKMGDADEVLDLRDMLLPRLDDAKKDKMDRELADWFTKHFQTALRSGKAMLIAPVLGRAVETFGGRPEIKHLADALPMVRQSVGLCPSCGKPYRGTLPNCPQ